MSFINFSRRTAYLNDNLVQPDSPHGQSDLALAQATAALWWNETGIRKSFIWPRPDLAPRYDLKIADVQTWTRLRVYNGSEYVAWQIPWTVHSRIDNIAADMIFAAPDKATIRARLVATQCVDVVADTNGMESALFTTCTPMSPLLGSWDGDSLTAGYLWFYRVASQLTDPTLPETGTRKICLAIEVYYEVATLPSSNANSMVPIKLYSARILENLTGRN